AETVDGLAPGASCTVSETAEGYTTEISGSPATIEPGATAAVTVTNTRELTSLTINKTATGGDGTFTFDLACDSPAGETFSATGIEVTTADGTGSATVDNIPTGLTCTVTETDIPTGYTVDNAEVTAEAGGAVEFTNTGTGSLTIIKQASDDTPADLQFNIGYSCGAGTAGTVTLTAGSSETIDGIPGGVTCEVTETADGFSTSIEPADPVTIGVGQTATVTVTNTRLHPQLTIDKTTNGADDGGMIPVGSEVTWTYVVTNTGDVTASDVTVSDNQLDPGAISCVDADGSAFDGTLAPGESITCTATGIATAGAYTNTGTVTGTDPLGDAVGPVTDDSGYFGSEPSIDLVKTAGVNTGDDDYADAGETITYTFTVTNTGNVDLSGVSVTDPLFGTDPACTIGDLAAGATDTCTADYTLTQADVDAGSVHNAALATGTPPVGPDVTDPGEVTTPLPTNPALGLDKRGNLDLGDDGVATPGDVITYTFTVTNTGNVTLTNVVVTDPKLGDDYACPVGDLAVGAANDTCTGTYTLTQVDIDAGQVDNQAWADSSETDETPGTETVEVPWSPQLSIDKVTNGSDGPTLLAGTPITWTYTVTNTGNVTITGVSVTDDQGVTVSCDTDTLAPGASTTCEGTGSATAGAYTNIGSVSGTDPAGQPVTPATDDSSYFGAEPGVSIDKTTTIGTGTPGDGVMAVEGDPVTWTYTVTNTGNVDLTGVQVTDSVEGAICTVDLAAGASITCTAEGIATVGDYANTGTATAHYTDSGGTTVDLTDSDESSYTGVVHNQPSISQSTPTVTRTGDGSFDGTITISNASDNGEPATVYVTSMDVTVTQKVRGKDTPVAATCTVNGQPEGTLGEPIAVTVPDSTEVGFSCTLDNGEALSGQYTVTVDTRILNRDRTFSERTVVRF
ncbi:MAG: DUF5979 domain-containing protein, partial [Acidimicrobiales bacterium]